MPITSSFQTDVATMRNASTHVDQVANNLDAQLKQLESQIEAAAGAWQGQAATRYRHLQMRYSEDVRKLRAVLAEIALGLKTNAVNYEANEQQITSDMAATESLL